MQGNGKENMKNLKNLTFCHSYFLWVHGMETIVKQIYKHGTKINMQVTEKKRNKNKFDLFTN